MNDVSIYSFKFFGTEQGALILKSMLTGVQKKSGTQVNGYKTPVFVSDKFADKNVKTLNDTHTKIQVNQLDENVWFELITTNGTFKGLVQNANSAQLF